MSRAGWELWKLEFKMPQIRGAAGQGRLIYLLDTQQKEVSLLWIYTHAEFEKRPPDKTLKLTLLEMMESEEFAEENKDLANSISEKSAKQEEVAEEESESDRDFEL